MTSKQLIRHEVIDMMPESGHGYLELVLFLESAGRPETHIEWDEWVLA